MIADRATRASELEVALDRDRAAKALAPQQGANPAALWIYRIRRADGLWKTGYGWAADYTRAAIYMSIEHALIAGVGSLRFDWYVEGTHVPLVTL